MGKDAEGFSSGRCELSKGRLDVQEPPSPEGLSTRSFSGGETPSHSGDTVSGKMGDEGYTDRATFRNFSEPCAKSPDVADSLPDHPKQKFAQTFASLGELSKGWTNFLKFEPLSTLQYT